MPEEPKYSEIYPLDQIQEVKASYYGGELQSYTIFVKDSDECFSIPPFVELGGNQYVNAVKEWIEQGREVTNQYPGMDEETHGVQE